MATAMMTTIVADTSCARFGQSTLRSSAHDSPAKARMPPRRSRLAPVWLFGCVVGLISRPRRARVRSGWAGAWKSLRFRRVRDGRATVRLPRLPVQGVAAAPAAVLLRLEAVRRVPLRLLGLVIASLALRARERDPNSYSCCHRLSVAFVGRGREVAAVGLEPTTHGL